MASKGSDKENKPNVEFDAFQRTLKERRKKEGQRANKKLKQKWRQAAMNVRGMRTYGGGYGPRLRRSFKEIQNQKYIVQRQGELALQKENKELKEINRKLEKYNKFLLKNNLLSMLDGEKKLSDETRTEMQRGLIHKDSLSDDSKIGTIRDLIGEEQEVNSRKKTSRPLPNPKAFTPEKPKRNLFSLSDSPYNL